MFKRRLKLSLAQQIKELLWPSMGWSRTFVYIGHRLIRLKDTTYSITSGLATGTSISFTPLPGTHLLFGAGFNWLLRGNFIAFVIGTLVGNPWTIPFMWYGSYKLGKAAFEIMGFRVASMPAEFTWHNLVAEIQADPWALLLPWVFGGYAMAILTWPLWYAIFYWMIIQARARQVQWKQARVHRISQAMTEKKP